MAPDELENPLLNGRALTRARGLGWGDDAGEATGTAPAGGLDGPRDPALLTDPFTFCRAECPRSASIAGGCVLHGHLLLTFHCAVSGALRTIYPVPHLN
jgi:hypothetical protein